MAELRRFELDDLLVRPGTYFNPSTEVLLIVDDSLDIDQAAFPVDHEGSDWVLVSDEVPVDEATRDELIEGFQARHHDSAPSALTTDDEIVEDEAELEPDEDQ